MNTAQAVAKFFINTNIDLVPFHQRSSGVRLILANLVNEKTHHELLIFEGLLALTNISAGDDELRKRILIDGGWLTVKGFLSESNLQIVQTSIELLSNLSLVEESLLSKYTNLSLESAQINGLFKLHSPKSTTFAYACVSFMANLIDREAIHNPIKLEQDMVTQLIQLLLKEETPTTQGLHHRVLYILADLSETLKLQKFLAMELSPNDVRLALSKISSNPRQSDEVKRMCEQLSNHFN